MRRFGAELVHQYPEASAGPGRGRGERRKGGGRAAQTDGDFAPGVTGSSATDGDHT